MAFVSTRNQCKEESKDTVVQTSGSILLRQNQCHKLNERKKMIGARKRKASSPVKSLSRFHIPFETMIVRQHLTKETDSRPFLDISFSFVQETKICKEMSKRRCLSDVDRERTTKEHLSVTKTMICLKMCVSCHCTDSPLWRIRKIGGNEINFCNACGIRLGKYRVICWRCFTVPLKHQLRMRNCPSCGFEDFDGFCFKTLTRFNHFD